MPLLKERLPGCLIKLVLSTNKGLLFYPGVPCVSDIIETPAKGNCHADYCLIAYILYLYCR